MSTATYLAFTGRVPNKPGEDRDYRIEIMEPGDSDFGPWKATRNKAQAEVLWAGLNLGNGYQARLLVDGELADNKACSANPAHNKRRKPK